MWSAYSRGFYAKICIVLLAFWLLILSVNYIFLTQFIIKIMLLGFVCFFSQSLTWLFIWLLPKLGVFVISKYSLSVYFLLSFILVCPVGILPKSQKWFSYVFFFKFNVVWRHPCIFSVLQRKSILSLPLNIMKSFINTFDQVEDFPFIMFDEIFIYEWELNFILYFSSLK